MERRLKMMIAGSIAVWVPVVSAAQAQPEPADASKFYRLKVEAAPASPVPTGRDAD